MTTPAGWYNDGSGRQRYWGGTQWTAHFAPTVAPAMPAVPLPQPSAPSPVGPFAAPPAYGPAPSVPRKKPRVGLYIGLGLGAVLLITVIAVVSIVWLLRSALGGPQDAFNALTDAWQAKDCVAEHQVIAERSTTTVADYCATRDYSWVDTDYADWDISVTGVERVNDFATVTARERFTDLDTGERQTEIWVYEFEKIDGDWLFVQTSETMG